MTYTCILFIIYYYLSVGKTLSEEERSTTHAGDAINQMKPTLAHHLDHNSRLNEDFCFDRFLIAWEILVNMMLVQFELYMCLACEGSTAQNAKYSNSPSILTIIFAGRTYFTRQELYPKVSEHLSTRL